MLPDEISIAGVGDVVRYCPLDGAPRNGTLLRISGGSAEVLLDGAPRADWIPISRLELIEKFQPHIVPAQFDCITLPCSCGLSHCTAGVALYSNGMLEFHDDAHDTRFTVHLDPDDKRALIALLQRQLEETTNANGL